MSSDSVSGSDLQSWTIYLNAPSGPGRHAQSQERLDEPCQSSPLIHSAISPALASISASASSSSFLSSPGSAWCDSRQTGSESEQLPVSPFFKGQVFSWQHSLGFKTIETSGVKSQLEKHKNQQRQHQHGTVIATATVRIIVQAPPANLTYHFPLAVYSVSRPPCTQTSSDTMLQNPMGMESNTVKTVQGSHLRSVMCRASSMHAYSDKASARARARTHP